RSCRGDDGVPRVGARRADIVGRRNERAAAGDGSHAPFRPVQPRAANLGKARPWRHRKAVRAEVTGVLDGTRSRQRLHSASPISHGLAMPKKMRADQLLVERGLVESRARAQALILAGLAYAGERKIAKAGDQLPEDAALTLKGRDHPWVS